MRAVIREILARRMPHPPEEFVAIQVSRLNEALLIAFSAMSPSNLKAVDQVVKIVRELDRYGGAFAAEGRRPEASRLDAPTDEDAAFASAWLHGAEPEPQDLEAAAPFGLAAAADLTKDAALASDPAPAGDDRSGNPVQHPEKIDSAPGIASAAMVSADPGASITNVAARWSRLREAGHGVAPLHEGPGFPATASAGGHRPENSTQHLEKIESAPSVGSAPTAEGRRRGRRSAPSRAPVANRPRSARRRTPARKTRCKSLKRFNPRLGGAASRPL